MTQPDVTPATSRWARDHETRISVGKSEGTKEATRHGSLLTRTARRVAGESGFLLCRWWTSDNGSYACR